jgi:ribosomal protein S6--L-glutamate ligase
MEKTLIGWQEWCKLEEVGLGAIKAKVDTGATTSCLHAFEVSTFTRKGKKYVSFSIHPLQNNKEIVKVCVAPFIGTRVVANSGGEKELRYVIRTNLKLGEIDTDIEITLTDRDSMKFRMLLGREALAGRFIVDSEQKFLLGKLKTSSVKNLYKNNEDTPLK